MERIIIIALILLWLAIIFVAGVAIEAAAAGLKNNRKSVNHTAVSRRKNIRILPTSNEYKCEKIAS